MIMFRISLRKFAQKGKGITIYFVQLINGWGEVLNGQGSCDNLFLSKQKTEVC